jgi:hypothetical protein
MWPVTGLPMGPRPWAGLALLVAKVVVRYVAAGSISFFVCESFSLV